MNFMLYFIVLATEGSKSYFCFLVLKPSAVKHTDAVCVLSDAVKAYTALYYLAKIQSGDTVLLFNADSVSLSFFIVDYPFPYEWQFKTIVLNNRCFSINLHQHTCIYIRK